MANTGKLTMGWKAVVMAGAGAVALFLASGTSRASLSNYTITIGQMSVAACRKAEVHSAPKQALRFAGDCKPSPSSASQTSPSAAIASDGGPHSRLSGQPAGQASADSVQWGVPLTPAEQEECRRAVAHSTIRSGLRQHGGC